MKNCYAVEAAMLFRVIMHNLFVLFRPYLNASLVVVDEAGYLPVTTQEGILLFQFISYRYEKAQRLLHPTRALPTGRNFLTTLSLPLPYWIACFIIAGSLISRGIVTDFREGISQGIRKEVIQ